MSAAPVLRRAAAADLPALVALERACFADPWSESALAAELALPQARLEVAVTGVGVVGYAAWRLLPGEAELLKVAVRPALRRGGIARQLIERGLVALAAAGARSFHLEVRESNHGAIALYERLGFAVVGRRAAYYSDGSAALLLRREA